MSAYTYTYLGAHGQQRLGDGERDRAIARTEEAFIASAAWRESERAGEAVVAGLPIACPLISE